VRRIILPDGATRSALTHIYFSLHAGEVSRFHRVTSDEIWNLYQGEGLILYTWDGTETPPTRTVLSASSQCFCHVVSAGMWQAAEPLSDAVLVGCSVAPGFEFDDFALLDPGSAEARRLAGIAPELMRFVRNDGRAGQSGR
jgi:predicted cupin superfamily sugar epimerase